MTHRDTPNTHTHTQKDRVRDGHAQRHTLRDKQAHTHADA